MASPLAKPFRDLCAGASAFCLQPEKAALQPGLSGPEAVCDISATPSELMKSLPLTIVDGHPIGCYGFDKHYNQLLTVAHVKNWFSIADLALMKLFEQSSRSRNLISNALETHHHDDPIEIHDHAEPAYSAVMRNQKV